jgi:ABC-type antimicrobial peptide transport system permease subunit
MSQAHYAATAAIRSQCGSGTSEGRRGVGLALVGTAAGAAVAAIMSRALQALLADVSPTDGISFAVAVALAMVMTIAGSLLPALRAVRVDPIEVMRAE